MRPYGHNYANLIIYKDFNKIGSKDIDIVLNTSLLPK